VHGVAQFRTLAAKMKPGLTIIVVDPDDDYLGLEISAHSDRFSGATRIYGSHDELVKFSDSIEGFPTSASDSRHYMFGHFDPTYAGGGLEAHFKCIDGSGHCTLRLRFFDDQGRYGAGTADFSFQFEPASLDEFISTLRKLSTNRIGDSAMLVRKIG